MRGQKALGESNRINKRMTVYFVFVTEFTTWKKKKRTDFQLTLESNPNNVSVCAPDRAVKKSTMFESKRRLCKTV